MSTVPTPDGPVFTSSFMNGFFSKERRLAQMGSHHEADLQAREATHIVHYRNAIENKRLKAHPGHTTRRPVSVVRRDPLLRDGLGHYAGWKWHQAYVQGTLSRFMQGKPIL